MKKKILSAVAVTLVIAWTCVVEITPVSQSPVASDLKPALNVIHDTVKKGETLSRIFSKHELQPEEIMPIRNASLAVHPVRMLHPGNPYKLEVEEDGRVSSFRYWIDDDSLLDIRKGENGFHARREPIRYQTRTLVLEGTIEDNLVNSMGMDRERYALALALSDIYAWDIDFTGDLQKGDSYRIVAEGLYLNGKFRKFGRILAAEFRNRGEVFKAYCYELEGRTGYYDEKGNALKKSFLRAPLSFRRISSHYSSGRFHPVLKIRRPHRGLDYAAAAGTPVSSIGDGVVLFAGRRGQYGNLVVISHPNGWETRYGHLCRISKKIKAGSRVAQGQVIGNVGSTGLATGPHLHYEVKVHGKNINPLTVSVPRGGPIPQTEMQAFNDLRRVMDVRLASGNAFAVTAALPGEEKTET